MKRRHLIGPVALLASAAASAQTAPPKTTSAGPEVFVAGDNTCRFAEQYPGNRIFGAIHDTATGKVLLVVVDPTWTDVTDGAQERLTVRIDDSTFDDLPAADRVINGSFGRSAFFADDKVLAMIAHGKTLTMLHDGKQIGQFDLARFAGLEEREQACSNLAAEFRSGKTMPPPSVPAK
jgi:hypothetical protein